MAGCDSALNKVRAQIEGDQGSLYRIAGGASAGVPAGFLSGKTQSGGGSVRLHKHTSQLGKLIL